jgi:hypothetical protein
MGGNVGIGIYGVTPDLRGIDGRVGGERPPYRDHEWQEDLRI